MNTREKKKSARKQSFCMSMIKAYQYYETQERIIAQKKEQYNRPSMLLLPHQKTMYIRDHNACMQDDLFQSLMNLSLQVYRTKKGEFQRELHIKSFKNEYMN